MAASGNRDRAAQALRSERLGLTTTNPRPRWFRSRGNGYRERAERYGSAVSLADLSFREATESNRADPFERDQAGARGVISCHAPRTDDNRLLTSSSSSTRFVRLACMICMQT